MNRWQSWTAVLLLAMAVASYGQDGGPWKGKSCAVVLTYDDALNVDLDSVVPALDSAGLKGTFYIIGYSAPFRTRLADWARIARNGHELGNHTLFHPCEGTAPGREWVPRENDLSRYTVRRMADEIAMANTLLEAVDGRTERTFAYPCGDMKAGDSSYVQDIVRMFPGARGVQGKMESLTAFDMYNVGAYMINGESGQQLIDLVKEAKSKHALVVFLFHGVGGEHNINVSVQAHSALLHYLKDQHDSVWVAPMLEVCKYVKPVASGR
jgi:peptidoglycan-N-acetylglucosamine deacetylase